ncbi:MAG TPA: MipA/OmpV family protein [Rhodocyclaceae bacterium]|nr:MipA/OmpV family protein [Rhodocyclaceae bacterium]
MKAARIAAAIALLPALAAAGEEKPLWEIGAGIAALSFPAYRGSDKEHNFLMPVPYVAYHGDFLKADRHGIRGSLLDSHRVDLVLSLSASPPTRSGDVVARTGMPDLKPTAEFGPQVDVTLWRSENRARFIKLRLPVRAAFTVEHPVQDIGWIFSPNLNMDITDLPGLPDWNLGLVAGPIWATKKQHDYFYGVAPQYATVTRPPYEARSGYSGSQFLAALSRHYRQAWVGAFVRYDTLAHATFVDSPLLAKKSFAAAGVAVSWVIDESKTRVWVDE